jgi:hypothetical protein
MVQLSKQILEVLWEDSDFILSRSTLADAAIRDRCVEVDAIPAQQIRDRVDAAIRHKLSGSCYASRKNGNDSAFLS